VTILKQHVKVCADELGCTRNLEARVFRQEMKYDDALCKNRGDPGVDVHSEQYRL